MLNKMNSTTNMMIEGLLYVPIEQLQEKFKVLCETSLFYNPDYPKSDHKSYIDYVARRVEIVMYQQLCRLYPTLEVLQYKKAVAVTKYENLYNPEESDDLHELANKASKEYSDYLFEVCEKHPTYSILKKWGYGYKCEISPY